MECQALAIFYSLLASAWIQTPQHVSLSVTIVLTTFPRFFGHFLESLIAIIFILQLATVLEEKKKNKPELKLHAKVKHYKI